MDPQAIVIGGGPAGLAAAYGLSQQRLPSVILEQDRQVGGLSKTIEYRGFRFDIGPHRFFTKSPEIQTLWQETLGEDFLVLSRLTRIYYRGKFFHYPLRLGNALASLGPYDSLRVLASYFKARLLPVSPELSFEDWVSNRFGRVLHSIFFKTYTEKLWGIPCTQLSAEWAAQRIRNLSLSQAVLKALGLSRDGQVASLIGRFHYPRYGPGQMYETLGERVKKQGGRVHTGEEVVAISHAGSRLTAVHTWGPEGRLAYPLSHCFSSMPLTELVLRMQPPAPEAVQEAAGALRYRSIITVNLLLNRAAPLPDNWIYLHAPEIRAGRLQFYGNWTPAMVPVPGASSLGFEYFCFEGDDLWRAADEALIQLAQEDLARLGFLAAPEVFDGLVVRYAKAYPLYEEGFQPRLKLIRDWLGQFANLYCIGRYGQFRYNNMDHAIMTGLLAVRQMRGEPVDPWSVNAEAEYLEETSRLSD
jgi:protoporphyrinogen oxidase